MTDQERLQVRARIQGALGQISEMQPDNLIIAASANGGKMACFQIAIEFSEQCMLMTLLTEGLHAQARRNMAKMVDDQKQAAEAAMASAFPPASPSGGTPGSDTNLN